MKTRFIISLLLLLIVADTAFSQTRRRTTRRKPAATSGYAPSGYGTTSDTTKPKQQSGYGNQPSGYGNQPSGYGNQTSGYGNAAPAYGGIDTTLPIQVMPSSTNGLTDSFRTSLRNDAAVDQNLVRDKAPLEYEQIREDDAVYRVRVWREIDAREKLNLAFRYGATEDNGNQRFISILLKAIKDSITAFSPDDDRFTTPITPDQAMSVFGGGNDTVPSYDLQGNITGYQVRAKAVDPDSIYKFRLKEEWIFDKESSRLFVRILGIAPVISQKLSNGEILPNSEHAVFWVYYPDLRGVLAKYEVYNPKNFGQRMTWEELFEDRMFSSYIVKSTLDNPYDQSLKEYIKDPLFRLLEGENIKQKIFDYEQSLWSY